MAILAQLAMGRKVRGHRLTTVERCDWLLWVDKGRIVMQGPPQEVLAAYKA